MAKKSEPAPRLGISASMKTSNKILCNIVALSESGDVALCLDEGTSNFQQKLIRFINARPGSHVSGMVEFLVEKVQKDPDFKFHMFRRCDVSKLLLILSVRTDLVDI